ncbi:MAG: YfhO family protein [Chloroflexi bacterium]|nr:YfhO family protein [Chloroflexota bacterium]
MAAVQLLPGWEFTQLSTRARLSFASASGGFLYSELVSLIQPGLRLLYLGILPTLLAALGLLFRWKREVIFWSGVALLSLLLSLGGQSFTYVAAYLVAPGFSLFRGQERAALTFAFASSVLAGYGARALLGPMVRPQRRLLRRFVGVVARVWLAALALALAAYLVAEYGNRSGQGGIYGPLERSVFLALFLGFGGLIVAARSRGRSSLVLGISVLILTALELFSLNWRNDLAGPESPRRFQAGPAAERMRGDPGLFRIQDDDRIPGNFGCVLGLQDIGGISPLKVQRYETLVAALPEERKWQLLNVKYLYTDRTSVPGATLLGSYGKGQLLYQVSDPGARASIVFQAQVEPDERRALALVAGPGFDPRLKVVLSQSPGIPIGSGGRGQARVTAYSPERIEVVATLDGNGVLVLSEVYYPGWRVFVDGREDRLLLADFALRAVALPAGEHRVVLVYDPWTFKAGALLSLASLATCIAFLALGARALIHRPGT